MNDQEKMTPEEAMASLKKLAESDDYESAHIEADGVLCALLLFYGQDEVVKAFDEVGKLYA